MSPRFEIDVSRAAGGFDLSLQTSWDAPSVALFGPSGAGKSTLIEILAGVRRADRSRILFEGRLIEESARGVRLPPEERRLGWVPQEGALFPHLSVRGNVEYGLSRRADRAAMERAIEILEIGPLLERRPEALSGGERQRVALARALASGARALLLDEPLASLDLPLRGRIFPYLLRLRDGIGLPIVYVTHDAGEALAIAEHVLLLDGGRLVAAGSPEEVLHSSSALRLLDLVAGENRFVVQHSTRDPGSDLLRLTTGAGLALLAPAWLAIRPGEVAAVRQEDILLAVDRPTGLSAQNILPGEILSMRDEGGRIRVEVRAGGESFRCAVTRHAGESLGLMAGLPIHLVFKAHAVHRIGPAEPAG